MNIVLKQQKQLRDMMARFNTLEVSAGVGGQLIHAVNVKEVAEDQEQMILEEEVTSELQSFSNKKENTKPE